ncbi:YoaK family protein [Sphingopyxis fribergensis]
MAVGISMLAGFVDAIGFVETAGFFVSFMTGNSTRFAVGAAQGHPTALIAGGIIALFLTGVIMGSLLAARAGSARTIAVLSLVVILLALATRLRLDGPEWLAVACLALAMGLVNAALAGKDGAVVGVTYMTGTLVQMGHKIANALQGKEDRQWLPHLALWAGLVAGAMIGARLVLWSAPVAYGAAALLAALLMSRALVLLRASA